MATLVSSLLSVTSEWASDLVTSGDGPFDDDPFDEHDDTRGHPGGMLVESFIGVSYAETTAALTVMEPMLTDELEAAKVRRALASRRHPMPEHVTGVRDIVVTQAGHVGDELGDEDNLVLGLAWPGTHGVTAVIYVDEAFGTRVKDVFLVPEAFEIVLDRYRELIAEQGRRASDVTRIDLADARASLELAIAAVKPRTPRPCRRSGAARTTNHSGGPRPPHHPRCSCGGCRPSGSPVLSGNCSPIVRRMPVAPIPVSPESALVQGPHARAATELIAFDAAQWAGHPLRLSPLKVELALSQRLPWAPAPDEVLDAIGDVPAYVRFAHARLGFRPLPPARPSTPSTSGWATSTRPATTPAMGSTTSSWWRWPRG